MRRQARTTVSMVLLGTLMGLWAPGARAQDSGGDGLGWPPPEKLVWFAQNLTGEGAEVQEARQALIQHVQEAYLASPDATRSVPLTVWVGLSRELQEDLTAEAKTAWVSGLRLAYLEDAAAAGSLFLKGARRLEKALTLLGQEGGGAVLAEWVEAASPWETRETQGVLALAQNLGDLGEKGDPARQALAEGIAVKYLGSAANTRSVTLGTWDELTGVLAKDLSTEARGQWVSGLRSAYVEDTQTFLGLKLRAVGHLSAALNHLSDQRCREIAPAWLAQTTSWQELDPEDLVSLAQRLKWCGEAGEAARAELGSYVTNRYLGDPAATRSVRPSTWLALASRLKVDLSAETRGQWVTDLRASYLMDAETAANLRLVQVQNLVKTFGQLGVEGAAAEVAQWAEGTKVWKSMNPLGLVHLAEALADVGEAGAAARTELAEHLLAEYRGDPESVRSVTPAHWRDLTKRLRKTLSPEEQSTWAEALETAYVQDAAALKKLSLDGVAETKAALRNLGVSAPFWVTLQWMDAVEWRNRGPTAMVKLAGQLRHAGAATQEARRQVVEHVTQTYCADPAAVKTVELGKWNDLVRVMSGDLSADDRSAWAAGLWTAYVKDAPAFEKMKLDGVKQLSSVLNRLGHPRAFMLVPVWAERTEAWQSLGPQGLVSLAQRLRRHHPVADAVRQHLIERVEGQYLASPEAAAKLTVQMWKDLVQALVGKLSPESRELWLDRLQAFYAGDDQTIAAMKRDRVTAVAQCLALLGSEEAAHVAVVWLENHDLLQVEGSKGLSTLAEIAVGDPEGGDFLVTLDMTWVSADEKKRFDLNTIWRIMRTWASAGGMEKVREWITRAYNVRLGTEESRSSAGVPVLTRLADLMVMGGLTGKGKGYMAFATVLARCARETGLAKANFKFLGYPLGTPEARDCLREELVDVDGMPRLGVAKTLAWANRHVDEMDSWCAYLDERVEQSEGDAKSLWLAAKGYAMTLAPRRPTPVRRRRWLNEALAVAETDRGSLLILREFADFYRSMRKPGAGAEMFESLKQQFGPEAAAEVEKLQRQLQGEEAKRLAAAARREAAGKIAEDESSLAWDEEGSTEETP